MGVILLVRHGQASFGAADYDELSELGDRQAERLGHHLHSAAIAPVSVIAGSMRRQGETARGILRGAGWNHDIHVDRKWNEFDHLALVAAFGGPSTDPVAFQQALESSMQRWARGEIAHVEAFGAFRARVFGGLRRLAGSLESGQTAVVVTSAGVISCVGACLLAGDVAQWLRLNRVCVNTGVTKIVSGRTGLSLISFNEHGHLASGEVTYR